MPVGVMSHVGVLAPQVYGPESEHYTYTFACLFVEAQYNMTRNERVAVLVPRRAPVYDL